MLSELAECIDQYSDPLEFERLCCDVLSYLGFNGIDPQGTGRKDGGKDALWSDPQNGRTVFHFSLRRDWFTKAAADIETTRNNQIDCDHFVFFTNRKSSAARKDNLKKLCKERLGCDLELYDQERLRVVLLSSNELRSHYFPNHFLETDVLDRLESILALLDHSNIRRPTREELRENTTVAPESVEEVVSLAATGQYERAEISLEKLHRATTEHMAATVTAYWLVGGIYFENGNRKLAAELWRKGKAIYPEHFGILFNLALSHEYNVDGIRYGAEFDSQKAIKGYEEALERAVTPQDKASCIDNQSVVKLKIGDHAGARSGFERALIVCPEYESAKLNLASLNVESDESRLIFESIANDLSPVRNHAYLALATHYVRRMNWNSALRSLRRLPNSERDANFYAVLAEIALKRSRFRRAKVYCEKSLSLNPNLGWCHYLLGVLHKLDGELNLARTYFRYAVRCNPSYSVQYFEYAAVCAALGGTSNLKEAARAIETPLELYPKIYNAHNTLGLVYASLGMEASALASFAREAQLNPKNIQAHFNLGYHTEHDLQGRRHNNMGRIRRAMEHYTSCLEIDGDYGPALTNLGIDFIVAKKPDFAVELLERAIALNPNNDSASGNLGIVLLLSGQKAEALCYLERAAELNPSSPYILHALAVARGDKIISPQRVTSKPEDAHYRGSQVEGRPWWGAWIDYRLQSTASEDAS